MRMKLAVFMSLAALSFLVEAGPTWKKSATIPIVTEGAACNSTTDRVGVTAANVILSCQSGVWHTASLAVAFRSDNSTNSQYVAGGGVTAYLGNFNSVSLNLGSGFNPVTGVFTAPRSGFYYFTGYSQVAQGQLPSGIPVYTYIIGPQDTCRTQLNQISSYDSQTTTVSCLMRATAGDQFRLATYFNYAGSFLMNSYMFSGFFVGS